MATTTNHEFDDTAVLSRMYLDEGMTLAAIGERCGMSEWTVRKRLKTAGHTLRRRGGGVEGNVSTVELARLYFDEGLSLAAVGTRTGMSEAGVGCRLKTAGYTLRSRGGNSSNVSAVALARLYFDEGLSQSAVGARVGLSPPTVRKRLLAAGYTLRPVPGSVSTSELARLYIEEGLTCAEAGERVGLSTGAVRVRLSEAGLQLRAASPRPKVPTAELERLYFDEGLRFGQVADRVGLTRRAVHERLKRTGRPLRAPAATASAGHSPRTNGRSALSTKEMTRLRIEEGLSYTEIGQRAGIAAPAVSARVRRANPDLFDGRTAAVSADVLTHLHFGEGLTIAETARRVSMTPHAVAARLRRSAITEREHASPN